MARIFVLPYCLRYLGGGGSRRRALVDLKSGVRLCNLFRIMNRIKIEACSVEWIPWEVNSERTITMTDSGEQAILLW